MLDGKNKRRNGSGPGGGGGFKRGNEWKRKSHKDACLGFNCNKSVEII